jgi:uncharacterized cofD-like protein
MRKDGVICTIGGGSGMPIVNKALILAGFGNIRSIVTTFDSGGDTGRMRTDERGRILAFSDYWRSLISLWQDGKQKENWEEMLRFRDGRGRNFGNMFFQFMAERVGNLAKVDKMFGELTGAELKGEVVPVSLEPADICFKTKSGKEYCGEHYLDSLRMSLDGVEEIWLDPEVSANEEAVEAIRKAEVIIMCPGSMYSSVIINLLPKGIREAYQKSMAKKILMTNIMSVANENNGFSQEEYVKVFEKYLEAKNPFDLVIMVDLDKLDKISMDKVLEFYKMENSYPLKYLRNVGSYKTVLADIGTIENKNMRLRHSEEKLAKFFRSLEF